STLTAKVSLPGQYNDPRASIFFDQLLARARSIPNVRAAGAAGWLPVVDAGGLWGIEQEGRLKDADWSTAVPQQVTPGYFKAIGQRIVAGRDFTDADRENAPLVAVVSEQFAQKVWPGMRALEKRFKLGGNSP